MSEALINRLVEFAESGNQQKIVLNGNSYQGWIMEISDDALLISTGFSDKQNCIIGILARMNGCYLNFKILR